MLTFVIYADITGMISINVNKRRIFISSKIGEVAAKAVEET